MSKILNILKHDYENKGYFVIRQFFSHNEIILIREVISTFHESWKQENEEFYMQEAFNSSLITGSEYLSEDERIKLFNFISSTKMMNIIEEIIENKPVFMNTQLFFNPVNCEQKDFWHRDCQYDHDVEMQKKLIKETQVVHLRVPIFDEPGLELIPGTHKRWDSEEEFNVRYEIKGRESFEDLPMGEKISLKAGDLLVFSADMLHRGLYGLDRLALDILVFDSVGEYVDYIDEDCLPDSDMLNKIDNPQLYINSINLKSDR
jgi:ectoine hydroxylase-related dioxygenase (phytanoyl-CoA dioxygenase family)